jgi:hypothetical protein
LRPEVPYDLLHQSHSGNVGKGKSITPEIDLILTVLEGFEAGNITILQWLNHRLEIRIHEKRDRVAITAIAVDNPVRGRRKPTSAQAMRIASTVETFCREAEISLKSITGISAKSSRRETGMVMVFYSHGADAGNQALKYAHYVHCSFNPNILTLRDLP